MYWQSQIDPAQPWWADFLPFLQKFDDRGFPGCDQLNALLPDNLVSEDGQAIRFVPSTELDDGGYEHRIYTTGQVSTRPENWHDLFNALVWARFPRMKVAMNTLHFHALHQQSAGSRGHLRDALTLFDECGVVVFSSRPELLTALAQHDWPLLFQESGSCWGKELQIAICGHAMLEKFLSPYKSMTAKAMLLHLDGEYLELPRDELLKRMDTDIAERLVAGRLLTRPADLAPLPLAGIPGWWPATEQDEGFYADSHVFRPPPAGMTPVVAGRLS